jgi:UDP-galactopyranose mutase
MKKYDYLIVGAGFFGAVFAHEMTKRGKRVLVIDKRSHIGGNAYTEQIENINVHRYGAHIFHTSNEEIWRFITSLTEFSGFINSPLAVYKGSAYSLPFNMNTFFEMWGVRTAEEARAVIDSQRGSILPEDAKNLEERAISLVGTDVYERLIKGYTEKQWGKSCRELPAKIINRIPLRFTYDNNYFSDKYQGIPKGGYTRLFEKLLCGIEVLLDTDYYEFIKATDAVFGKTVFTGRIDAFFGYRFGALEYRSLRFENEILDIPEYQSRAVVNYTERDIPYTRIIEHKHFEPAENPRTVISREYPMKASVSTEPYYPINDEKNEALYKKYEALARNEKDVIFGGRLAEYKYYDMDEVIEAALRAARLES